MELQRKGYSQTLEMESRGSKPSRAERAAVADTKRRGLMAEFSELLSAETKRTGSFRDAQTALNDHVQLLVRRKPQEKILVISAIREFERRFNDAVAQVKEFMSANPNPGPIFIDPKTGK